jgi:uncharacterized membrane protein YkvA (DUF1232 family)
MASSFTRPWLLRRLFSQAQLALRLLREPHVPVLAKALPFLALAYTLSPIDVVPDVLPLLGQIDDLAIIVIVLEMFIRLAPTQAKVFHREAVAHGRRYSPMTQADDFIDAEWRRE